MLSRQIAAVLLKSRGLAVASAESAVSDRELLRRFADERDEGAFTLLVWRHGALVWRVCRGIIANEQDAEDVFQATFLVLARKAASSGWHDSVANWLYETAYRLARKARAAGRRRAARLGQLEGQLPAAESADEMTMREGRAVLYEELAALPEALRAPLVLCYLEGATQEQAARRLGWSHRTLRRRLDQGKDRLGERLTRRGIGLSVLLLTGGLTRSALAAGVPPMLPAVTVQAALAFAVSGSAGAGASAPAAALANGVLRSVLLVKGSLLAVVLAAVVAVAGGVEFLVAKAPETQPEERTEPTSPLKTAETRTGRVDRRGDPLPLGALARLGTVRLRHVETVHSLAFTRDGKGLIAAGRGNPARLWDTATGRLLRQFGDGRDNQVCAAALSSDGRTLAGRVRRTGDLCLWDAATGTLLRRLKAGPVSLNPLIHLPLAFSPDGKTVASANHLWETATGKELWSANRLQAAALAFSADGKALIWAGEQGDLHLGDVATGKEIRQWGDTEKDRHIYAFIRTPDGLLLTIYSPQPGAFGSVVHLWDVTTGKEMRQLMSEEGISTAALSPDGKVLATGSGDGSIRLWDMATGKKLRRCVGCHGTHRCLAFSPDGKTLASGGRGLGTRDQTVHLWDVESAREIPVADGGHRTTVCSVNFMRDGKSIVSGGRDGFVRVWDAETAAERLHFRGGGETKLVAAMTAVSPDGKIWASACTEEIVLWDARTNKELRRFPVPHNILPGEHFLAFSPDGKMLACSGLGTNNYKVFLWEVATGKELHQNIPGILGIAFSPDGALLAACGSEGGSCTLWEAATGKKLCSVDRGEQQTRQAVFSPDGRLLATSSASLQGYKLQLWPVYRGAGSDVRIGSPRPIAEWDRKNVGDWLFGLAFSPDGRTLAAADNKTIHLWETASGRERRRFDGHAGETWSLAFSPDGRRLVSGSGDTTLLVWDVTGRLQGGRLRPARLSAQELAKLWDDLAADDAGLAGRAIWTLTAAPSQAVPYLRERLRTSAVDFKDQLAKVPQFLRDLDDDAFAVRVKAKAELARLNEIVEPALRQALAKSPSVEARRSLEQLLEALEAKRPMPSGESLRGVRVREVLEHIGTGEARAALEHLHRAEQR